MAAFSSRREKLEENHKKSATVASFQKAARIGKRQIYSLPLAP